MFIIRKYYRWRGEFFSARCCRTPCEPLIPRLSGFSQICTFSRPRFPPEGGSKKGRVDQAGERRKGGSKASSPTSDQAGCIAVLGCEAAKSCSLTGVTRCLKLGRRRC